MRKENRRKNSNSLGSDSFCMEFVKDYACDGVALFARKGHWRKETKGTLHVKVAVYSPNNNY
eukprot:4380758-Amphidinium_carterae.1